MQQEMADRNHAVAEALDAAFAELDGFDDRLRAAQQATWQRAARVVDYETGRDLDLLEEAYVEDTGS